MKQRVQCSQIKRNEAPKLSPTHLVEFKVICIVHPHAAYTPVSARPSASAACTASAERISV
jgi:hypothetical protein